MSNSEHTFVYLFHILVVAPLFIYLGYKGAEAPKQLFTILIAMGVVIGLYHGYKLIAGYKQLSNVPEIKVI